LEAATQTFEVVQCLVQVTVEPDLNFSMGKEPKHMLIRLATSDDFDEIFIMGFDVWSDGQNENDYLDGCHASQKYKKGQWWVLSNDDGLLVSSLISYKLNVRSWGIGSLATPITFRGKGYASELLKGVCEELIRTKSAKAIFLFSDINPEFYEKHGFVALPKKIQKFKNTTCMVKTENQTEIWLDDDFEVPTYF